MDAAVNMQQTACFGMTLAVCFMQRIHWSFANLVLQLLSVMTAK